MRRFVLENPGVDFTTERSSGGFVQAVPFLVLSLKIGSFSEEAVHGSRDLADECFLARLLL